MTAPTPTKARRGFAAMDPEKRRAISRLGGASVKPEHRAYSQDRALASRAGRKGGQANQAGRGQAKAEGRP